MKPLKTIALAALLSFSLRAEDTNESISTNLITLDTNAPTWVQLDSSITEVRWQIAPTNELRQTVSTNLATNWIAYAEEPIKGKPTNIVNQRQVGTVSTNRMLTIVYNNATNHFILDVLGVEDPPTHHRKVQARKAGK